MKKIISLIMLSVIVMLTGCQKQVSEFDRIMSEYSFYPTNEVLTVVASFDLLESTTFSADFYVDETAEKEIQLELFGIEYIFTYRYTFRDQCSGIYKKKYGIKGDKARGGAGRCIYIK